MQASEVEMARIDRELAQAHARGDRDAARRLGEQRTALEQAAEHGRQALATELTKREAALMEARAALSIEERRAVASDVARPIKVLADAKQRVEAAEAGVREVEEALKEP